MKWVPSGKLWGSFSWEKDYTLVVRLDWLVPLIYDNSIEDEVTGVLYFGLG